jgi:hypothetical protein
MNIEKNIQRFLQGEGKNKGRHPEERYASYDYCFNYFQSFRDRGNVVTLASRDNLETSCLHLAFYLASWGMFRGSSFLLEKSAKHFQSLIEVLASLDMKIWNIDVGDYSDANSRRLLLYCKDEITNALGKNNGPTDTLITKVMLGVFGSVPAFDTYFAKGFKLRRFDEKSLESIFTFYDQNRLIIDGYRMPTIDFVSGKPTNRIYTKAKIIDMIGFVEGQS